jgi:acetolactate synthase-1/2/3 large subunit
MWSSADIDAAEISKNKTAHVPVCGDTKQALRHLNRMLEVEPLPADKFAAWRAEVSAKRTEFPMRYPQRDDVIVPQHAIEVQMRPGVSLP